VSSAGCACTRTGSGITSSGYGVAQNWNILPSQQPVSIDHQPRIFDRSARLGTVGRKTGGIALCAAVRFRRDLNPRAGGLLFCGLALALEANKRSSET
jgi:hypothetical protein